MIEVANSSYPDDKAWVGPRMARAGVPEYWIVNVTARRVEVYRNPHDDGPGGKSYDPPRIYALDDAVPLGLDGVAYPPIPVRDLFSGSIPEPS